MERELARCSCILSKFYIKPQPSARVRELLKGCILSKFYIKPQQRVRHSLGHSVVSYRNSTSNHNKVVTRPLGGRVVSYRNSTSNHNPSARVRELLKVVSYRNSTSNHNRMSQRTFLVNVVSYRNSTSNHNTWISSNSGTIVVSYRNSTSNHNEAEGIEAEPPVVSYRNSTSNHNSSATIMPIARLYLIEILHQTTTQRYSSALLNGCILSKFYIKPQPATTLPLIAISCILSKFYIKPQQRVRHNLGHSVVSYRNSTSNHNDRRIRDSIKRVVSYRNSTSNHNTSIGIRRSMSVVSYRNSTSNHNGPNHLVSSALLYLIEILHQTTTPLVLFIQVLGCILSKFYIKPQHDLMNADVDTVVSYRNSTSNHNLSRVLSPCGRLYLIEILHQTTTSGLILIDKVLLTGCLPL